MCCFEHFSSKRKDSGLWLFGSRVRCALCYLFSLVREVYTSCRSFASLCYPHHFGLCPHCKFEIQSQSKKATLHGWGGFFRSLLVETDVLFRKTFRKRRTETSYNGCWGKTSLACMVPLFLGLRNGAYKPLLPCFAFLPHSSHFPVHFFPNWRQISACFLRSVALFFFPTSKKL